MLVVTISLFQYLHAQNIGTETYTY